MPIDRSSAVSAYYKDLRSANIVVRRLSAAGIPRAQIHLLSGDDAVYFIEGERGGFWRRMAERLLDTSGRTEIVNALLSGGVLVVLSDLDRDEDEIAFEIFEEEDDGIV